MAKKLFIFDATKTRQEMAPRRLNGRRPWLGHHLVGREIRLGHTPDVNRREATKDVATLRTATAKLSV